jgi:hypothetical protein
MFLQAAPWTRRYPHLLMLLMFSTFMPVGCDSDSSEQRCTPQTQTGCRGGEACTVDVEGAPLCVAENSGTAIEGATCIAPKALGEAIPYDPTLRCGAALGCIAYLGVPRCLRFCDPESSGDNDSCGSPTLSEVARHPLSEHANCAITLFERSEIGACVLPCKFESEADSECPDHTQCKLGLGSTVATCLPSGSGQVGQECGDGCGCGSGQQCVSDPLGWVCRRKAKAMNMCPDTELALSIVGSSNPVSSEPGEPYTVCVACQYVGVGRFKYCKSAETCMADYGHLASLEGFDGENLYTAARSYGESTSEFPVGVVLNDDMVWTWLSSGTPVDMGMWAEEEPGSDVACVVLGSDGKLRGSWNCSGPVLCEQGSRPACDAPGLPD